MADKKISEMETASVINNDDNLELSHSVNGGFTSVKASILAIATKILTAINFTSALETTDKTVLGAINEVAQGGGGGGGASELDDLDDVEITNPTTGQALVYDETNEVWVNGAGGGGTTVIANPTGTPTDELETIQIGNAIYEIVGGGGGSGIIADKDLLWEYSDSYNITLAHPFTDYDFLVFEGNNYSDANHKGGAIISSAELEGMIGVSGKIYTFNGAIGKFANYTVGSTTSLTYVEGEAKVLRVWGIKFTSGGGSASWTDITGTLTAGQTEITLYGDVDSDSSIDVYTDKFGVNPTNIELGEGGFRLLQDLVSQESELDCTCTASSNFAANPPWAAFSSASNAGWVASGNGNPTWWKVDFGEEVGLKKVEYNSADPNRKQTLSGIQYSDDGTTWNDCTLSSNEYGAAILETRVVARYFKIYWTDAYAFSTYPMLTALAMYDYSSTEITLTFPVQSENLNVKVRVS